MVIARKWVLAKAFSGFPKESDFELQTEEISPVKDGEVLCESLFLSVDPYMRPWTAHDSDGVGKVMLGQVVARVISSKSPSWPVGMLVLCQYGWRTHGVVNPSDKVLLFPALDRLPEELGHLSPSLALGVLGAPGASAYLGIVKILKPKQGEIFLVNAAAGAVGSVAGQIGKIKGCNVIACAGTDEKCDWLRELGFDYVFNYKTSDLSEELKHAAPDGIDCYFDNVGGNFSTTVVSKHMRMNGRVAACGSISTYNDQSGSGPSPWFSFVYNQIKLRGFLANHWLSEWPAAFREMAQWIREGKLKIKETVTEGFEKMPTAFIGLFKGDNIGKAIVKV